MADNLLLHAARSDALTLTEIGRLFGDVELRGGAPGPFAQRLLVECDDLRLIATSPQFLGYSAPVSRAALGAWLHKYGSPAQKRSHAAQWSAGVGRIDPPAPAATTTAAPAPAQASATRQAAEDEHYTFARIDVDPFAPYRSNKEYMRRVRESVGHDV
jgi:hypothetical protein